MYCVKCGEKFDDNLKYCPFCGTSIDALAPEPEDKGDALGSFPEVKNPFLRNYIYNPRKNKLDACLFTWNFPIYYICVFTVGSVVALLSQMFPLATIGIVGLVASVLFYLIKKGKIKAEKEKAVFLVVIMCWCFAAYLILFLYSFNLDDTDSRSNNLAYNLKKIMNVLNGGKV